MHCSDSTAQWSNDGTGQALGELGRSLMISQWSCSEEHHDRTVWPQQPPVWSAREAIPLHSHPPSEHIAQTAWSSDTRIQCQKQACNLLKLQSQIVTEGNREGKLFHYSPRLTESLPKSLSFSAPFLCYFLVSKRHCQNREIIYCPSALKNVNCSNTSWKRDYLLKHKSHPLHYVEILV